MPTVRVSEETNRMLQRIAPTRDKAIQTIVSSSLESQKTQTIVLPKVAGEQIASGTESYEYDRIEFDGYINQIIIHFPPGVSSYVDVRVLYISPGGKTHYVLPSRDKAYITMDQATPIFKIMYPVEANGRIQAEWKNRDDTNDHYVPVNITIGQKPIPTL